VSPSSFLVYAQKPEATNAPSCRGDAVRVTGAWLAWGGGPDVVPAGGVNRSGTDLSREYIKERYAHRRALLGSGRGDTRGRGHRPGTRPGQPHERRRRV